MIPIDIFTDPEQWYEHSETLTSTDDLLELYHKTIDNVEINEDFDEASGFLDVFFTLQDHLVAAKRFDDLINLINKFKTKHQDYYQNHCFQYFQTELLKYYLYIGDETKARAAFELLAGNPLADIDSFLPSVQLILLYDKKEWVAEIAEKTFRTLHESDEIMGDGSLVGIHIFNNALEKGFEQFQTTGTCDWQTINDYLKKYEYQIDEKAQSDMEVAFAFDYNNDTLRSNKMNHQIATAFSKYMLLEKKMSFMTSYFLFSEMGEYWAKHKSKSKGQFNLNSQKFDQFCASPFTMFNPYKSGVTARLWGAQYVYDFLFKTGLINQTAFEDATDIINSLKKSLTKNPNHLCWEYGFYRFWEKADGESTEAYEAYIKHSQDSFEVVDIVEKKPFDSKALFDNLVSSMKHDVPRSSVSAESPKKELKQMAVRTEPKVGRNEPCTCGSGKKYKKCCGV